MSRAATSKLAEMSLDKNAAFMCHMTAKHGCNQVPSDRNPQPGSSLAALYLQHGAALAAYACSYGLDFASAEDVVQQLFAKLSRERPSLETPVGYLYRAVRNIALNHKRDRRREMELSSDELWFSHASAEPEEVLALQRSLSELPDEQRETIFLHVWSGMTFQEIAEITQTPLHTVASRYRYALDKLRTQLGTPTGKKAAHGKR